MIPVSFFYVCWLDGLFFIGGWVKSRWPGVYLATKATAELKSSDFIVLPDWDVLIIVVRQTCLRRAKYIYAVLHYFLNLLRACVLMPLKTLLPKQMLLFVCVLLVRGVTCSLRSFKVHFQLYLDTK